MFPVLFTCLATTIINLTPNWADLDEKVLSRAKYVCYSRYDSCLKKFIKKEEHLYNAICGRYEDDAGRRSRERTNQVREVFD